MPDLIDTAEAKYGPEKYWKHEQPVVAMVGSVLLRYFRVARKLQVIETYEGRNGYRRFSTISALDLNELSSNHESRALLQSVLESLDDHST